MSPKPPTRPWRSALDPRVSLRARVGLATGALTLGLALLLTLAASIYATGVLRARVDADLQRQAAELADKLDRGMFERYREIQLAASLPLFNRTELAVEERRRVLETMQRTMPYYAWLGLSDPDGTVLAATGGLLEGESVAERRWFKGGREGPFVVDLHAVRSLDPLLPAEQDPRRYVDLAAPVRAADGTLVGVLGGHLSWRWARDVQRVLLDSIEIEGVEALVLDRDGRVLLGPGSELGDDAPRLSPQAGLELEVWNGETYLAGIAPTDGFLDFPGLGWVTVVRQPLDVAVAPVRELARRLLAMGAVLGLLFAALGYVLAGSLTRPLRAITRAATEPQRDIPTLPGQDEVARLSRALRGLVDELQARNEELEQRVWERTARLHLLQRVTGLANRAEAAEPALREALEVLREVLGADGAELLEAPAGEPEGEVEALVAGALAAGAPRWSEHGGGIRLILPVDGGGRRVALALELPMGTSPDREIADLLAQVAAQLGLVLARERNREALLELQRELQEQALRDPLTGAYNRRYLDEMLDRELRRSVRSRRPLGLLMLDLDHFKRLNDAHGHAAGDAALRALTRFIGEHVRAEDALCRYGGEEFCLLLPGASAERSRALAERLRRGVRELEVVHEGERVGPLSLSVGVALAPRDGLEPDALLRAADGALYRAKQEGRNRVVLA